MLNRWRKYRNYICGRPLSLGDPEQIRMIERLKEPEEATDGFYENPEVYCPRCTHKFYVRTVQALDDRGRYVTRVVTPRVYTCTNCGGRVLYWRARYQEVEDYGFEFYEGALLRLFIHHEARPDELKYINPEYDPFKYYNKLLK